MFNSTKPKMNELESSPQSTKD